MIASERDAIKVVMDLLRGLDTDSTSEKSPSVHDVYGGLVVPIGGRTPPEGYRFTGAFRRPERGEWFLSVSDSKAARSQVENFCLIPPYIERLILELVAPRLFGRIHEVYGRVLSPPVGYRWAGEGKNREFRVPKQDEWFLTTDGEALRCIKMDVPRLILEPISPSPGASTTPTVESVYGRPLSQLVPPAGWRWSRVAGEVEFRVPKRGETTFLTTSPYSYTWSEDAPRYGFRLLLVRAQRLVMDVVDEDRAPIEDEWGQDEDGLIQPAKEFEVGWYDAKLVLSAPRLEDVPLENTQAHD